MYARKRDRMLMQEKWSKRKGSEFDDPTTFILKNLENIDQGNVKLHIYNNTK